MEPRFFEDVKLGDKLVTPGRTITETDIVIFAGMAGTLEPLFTDMEYVKKSSLFGRRFAQGTLVLSMSMGLAVQLGMTHGTVMGFLGIDQLRATKPVFCGDTIHVDVEVTEKKETRHADRGVVTTRRIVKNQDDEVVMTYMHTMLIRRRGTEGKPVH